MTTSPNQPIPTHLRNATLTDLAALLTKQQEAKIDVVVRADQLRSVEGDLIVPGVDTTITDSGVTATAGEMRPTDVCDGTLADRFGIPIKYLRTVRATGIQVPAMWEHDRQPLLDAMLNAHFDNDDRTVLVRGFKNDGDGPGIARAVLSDRYRTIDHLDSLMTMLDAARGASASVEVAKVDLSERFMKVAFVAPEIQALAPILLRNYRPPSETRPYGTSDGKPVVFAGFVASNSETGGGAFTVTPRFVVQICTNGMTRTKDALRQVHLGGRLEEGIVQWSEETRRANLDLIAQQTRDAVSTFLDVEYMTTVLTEIEAQADAPVRKPDETLKIVAQKLRYTETERENLLAHFIEGGQLTAGGVLNAVTSMAQVIEDPDRASEVEDSALDAMALAAAN